MKSSGYYRTPNFFLKLLLLIVSCLVCHGAEAQLYRVRGDQAIEAAVMESEIVLDAIQSSLEGSSIVNILYGHNVIGFNYAPGMYIRLDDMPSLALSTFETVDPASTIIEGPISEKLLSNMAVRMLLFRQRQPDVSVNHWGYELSQKPAVVSPELIPAPRVFLGDLALSWFALLNRDAGKRESGDNKWFVKTMAQDVEGSRPLSSRKSFENLRVMFGLKSPPKDRAPRYYLTPKDIQTWDQVLNRAQAAVAIKTKFDEMADSSAVDQEWAFYLEQLKEENIYSNYALHSIASMAGPDSAKKLLDARADLRFFVDDVWETALRMVQTDPYLKVADRLSSAVVGMANVAEPLCATAEGRAKSFADLLRAQGDPHLDQALGLADASKTLNAAMAMYDAELRCQLLEKHLDKQNLVPKEPTRDSALSLPENRGFTADEIGLVSSVKKLTAADYLVQQQRLSELSFPLTQAILNSIRATPTGVRVLLDYCAAGLEKYQEVALPDLTRGSSYVWREACRVIDLFEWPEDYCEAPDSGIARDVTDVNLVLARSILVGVEQDDNDLLSRSLALLLKNPSYERAQIAGMLISLTRKYSNKPVRAQLLVSMEKLPYFPVAKALAEEMAEAGSESGVRIARTLQQITGAEGLDRNQAKSWIFYLNEIAAKKKDSIGRPLTTGANVSAVLNKKPCSEVEYGWNRLFREKQL